ncbi:MAG: hypothetical protein ABI877_07850 [Gemmatimonadaceae bacterium]
MLPNANARTLRVASVALTRARITAAGLLIAIGMPAAAWTQVPATLTLLPGQALDVAVPTAVVEFPIPAEVKSGVDAAKMMVAVIDVSVAGLRSDALRSAFAVALVPPTGIVGPILNVTIKTVPALKAGTYDLVIAVGETGKPPEHLALKLTLVAATLDPPATLFIRRTLPALFFGGSSDQGTRLVLRETSGLSRVGPVFIEHDPIRDAEGVAYAGNLRFEIPSDSSKVQAVKHVEGDSVEVAPGKRVDMAVTLQGDFPLGKISVAGRIEAPQLKAAVPIRIDIETRRDPLTILVIAFLGLLFGYVLRVWLTYRIQRGTTRLEGLRLLKRLREEGRRHPDAEFRAELEVIWIALRRALDEGDSAAATAAMADANTKLAGALAAWVKRQSDLQSDIDAFESRLATAWSLPSVIADIVREARARIAKVRALVVAGDVVAGRADLTTLQQAFVIALDAAAVEYQGTQISQLDAVQRTPVVLPDVAKARVALREALDAIPVRSATPNEAALLPALHTARTAAMAMLELTGRAVAATADAVIRTLAGLPASNLSSQAAVQALKETSAKAAEDLRMSAAHPEEMLAALAPHLDALGKALTAAILSPAASATDAMREANKDALAEIESSLEAGMYVDAARKMVAIANKPGASFMGGPVKSLTAQAALEIFTVGALAPGGRAPDPARAAIVTQILGTTNAVDPLELETERTMQELFRAKLGQTALAGIGIMAVGYFIFAKTFVGTAGDVASIFAWAFTLDVSVATLVTLSSRVAATPPP